MNMKKFTGSLLGIIILVLLLLAFGTAASADVPIDKAHFPDSAFREALSNYTYYVSAGIWTNEKYLDTNRDGVFSNDEIANITNLYLSDKSITSLQGIEYLTALGTLYCDNNKLTKIDLSKNHELIALGCDNNRLTQLDVSSLTKLVSLNCDHNQLTSLDLSRNTALETVSCRNNQLTSLKVSQMKSLDTLNCEFNRLKELDISGDGRLTTVICYENQISTLKLNGANRLDKLWCFANKTKTIDVRNCAKLNEHMKGRTKRSSGSYSDGNRKWTYSYFESPRDFMTDNPVVPDDDVEFYFDKSDKIIGPYTSIEKIKISEENFPDANFRETVKQEDEDHDGYLSPDEANETVLYLQGDLCDDSQKFQSLVGIEHFVSLNSLTVFNHLLKSLNVSQNKLLTFLECSYNKIKTLNVSGNTRLTQLICYDNKLKTLNLSHNTSLQLLICYNNKLTSLDVSRNTKLSFLACFNNKLTSLDISHCPKLVKLVKNGKPSGDKYVYYGKPDSDNYLGFDKGVLLLLGDETRVAVGDIIYRISGSSATVIKPVKTNLKSLTIPDSIKVNDKKYKVTAIADEACKGMKKLAALTIGKNIKTIGKNAFYNCKALKNITIKTKKLTDSSVLSNAFKGISKKATFTCPKGKVNAYKKILRKKGASKSCDFK